MLEVVCVVAAGDDGAVVADEEEAVIAFDGVAVESEEVGAAAGRGEDPAGRVQPVAGVDLADCVGQVARRRKIGSPEVRLCSH